MYQLQPVALRGRSVVFIKSEGAAERPWVADIAEAGHRIGAVSMASSLSRSALLRGPARG